MVVSIDGLGGAAEVCACDAWEGVDTAGGLTFAFGKVVVSAAAGVVERGVFGFGPGTAAAPPLGGYTLP